MSPDVSGYYTTKSRNAIQQSSHEESSPYAFRMDFGNRLRDARNDAGLTGEKLGDLLGVSKQTIAHWEANRYEPKLMYLARLCEVLDVSADWLLTGKSVEHLSPAAVKQGRFYDALSAEGRRKWETAKLLIREGASDATIERRMPITARSPMNMGEDPISSHQVGTDVGNPDTLIANRNKHLELSIPGTGKSKGAKSDERSTDSGDESSQRGKHASSSPSPSRAGKT
jgi:transcriptional regulator with XRE-family HTH domain